MLNFKKIQSLLLTLVLILNLQISKELDALFLKLKSDACQITFQGKRNFYNSSDDQCYPMVECSPDQVKLRYFLMRRSMTKLKMFVWNFWL